MNNQDAYIQSIPSIKPREARFKTASKTARSIQINKKHQIIGASQPNITFDFHDQSTNRIIDYEVLKTNALSDQLVLAKVNTIEELAAATRYVKYQNINLLKKPNTLLYMAGIIGMSCVCACCIMAFSSKYREQEVGISIAVTRHTIASLQ